MAASGEAYLKVKDAAAYLGVATNTLRNWDAAGCVAVHRHPTNNYRLFTVADLNKIRRQIERTGVYPTGWPRDAGRNRKSR